MKQKKGGIITFGLIIIILIIVGFFWFIKNMDINTNVIIDLSRKPENNTNSAYNLTEGEKLCLENGHHIEIRVIKDEGVQSICIDKEENECDTNEYQTGDCTLETEEFFNL